MKKFLLLPVFLFFVSAAQSQVDVKINPLGLLFSSPDLSGEYIINESFGVELSLGAVYGFVAASRLLERDLWLSKSGYRIRLSGKYYFRPVNGGDRFYAGAYLGPRSQSISGDVEAYNGDVGYTQSAFSAGILAGYKWAADNGLIFEIGLGLGRAFGSKTVWNNPDLEDLSFDGFGLDGVGILAVGYRFGGGNSSSSSKGRKR